MANKNPFAIAEGRRIEITEEQSKQIRQMYKDIRKEFKQRIDALSKRSNISSVMRAQYLKEFQKDLENEIRILNAQLEGTIKSNILNVSRAVVLDSNNLAREMGFSGIFTSDYYIPTQVVNDLISGRLYEGKWTLSKAIWSDNQKKLGDINQIIAKGVAENKPTYDIAKDLERYVNPNARKDWKWSKVYPGSSKKVDYNAQRLARTMISHAYQESFVQSTKDNPFIESYRWLASGGDRMCDICAERDGKIFAKDELPMDHPNGMCTFEVVIEKSYEQIARDLHDWINDEGDSKLNSQLDDYAETLGYNVKGMTSQNPKVQNTNMQVQNQNNAIVNGKDISATWTRRSDQFDFEIEDVINAQGFDGLPRVVSADEFDKYVKEANGGKGFIAQRTYAAPNQEILNSYRGQLYNGKWYVDCSTGGAQYGQGMYCAANYEGKLTDGIKTEMKHYAGININKSGGSALTELVNKYKIEAVYDENGDLIDINIAKQIAKMSDEEFVKKFSSRWPELKEVSNAVSYTETLTLDKSAKIISYDDLVRMKAEDARDSIKTTDIGSYAAMKGYDAINAEGHGESGSYTIILNRTKCIFKGGE